MPCDQIRYCRVSLKAANRDILVRALNNLGYDATIVNGNLFATVNGYRVTFNKDNSFSIPERRVGNKDELINEINRAYSKEVVEQVAKNFDLEFVSTSDDELEGELAFRF
jgi:hypothetical protein